jgi:hypothetical protein
MFLPSAQAESPDTGAPGSKPSSGANVISANGFTCNQTGGGLTCKGAFKDIDGDLILSASGSQIQNISAQKKDKTYSYDSNTGCLCVAEKSSKECTNEAGKSEKFKGDNMAKDAASFCTGSKQK